MHRRLTLLPFAAIASFVGGAFGFTTGSVSRGQISTPATFPITALHAEGGGDASADPGEVIARRLVVLGDVNGGYYRSCVKNEASRFRKLIGTMSPPDESDERAEIYVEGKRKMVDGFVRWCQRGDIGLSQKIEVESVADEFPTGLYDDFYVQTGR